MVGLFGLAAMLLLGFDDSGLPLFGGVLLGWMILIWAIRRLNTDRLRLGFIPIERLRLFAVEGLYSVRDSLRGNNSIPAAVLSLFIWAISFGYFASIVLWLAGQDLTIGQTMGVFVVFFVGMGLPGMPGGVGVVEGATMAALVFFGVPKPQALTLILTIRFCNFLLPTIMGLTVLASVGGRDLLRNARQRAAEHEAA